MIAAAVLTILVVQVTPALGLNEQLRSLRTQLTPTADVGHASYDHPSWLPRCNLIYLDVGSNIGVQVRKLYEPEKYPKAQLLPDFTRSFGSPEFRRRPADESGLCALGLEPNPAHREHLGNLSEAYQQRGWRVHFYPVAAWSREGTLAFNTTAPRSSPNDTTAIGAHLQMQNSERKRAAASDEASLLSERHDTDVRTVNLASFIRSLPAGSVQIMKMDIEGAEWETLAEMLREDVLCQETVASAYIEAHGWGETTNWGTRTDFKMGRPRSFEAVQERIVVLDASGRCPGPATKVTSLDDESYPHDVDDDFLGTGTHSTRSAEAHHGEIPGALGDWGDVLRAGDGNSSNFVGTAGSEDSELVAYTEENGSLYSSDNKAAATRVNASTHRSLVSGVASARTNSSPYFVDDSAVASRVSASSLESLESSIASAEANATRDAELRLQTVLKSMDVGFAGGKQNPNPSIAEMVDDLLSSNGSGNRSIAEVGGTTFLSKEDRSPVVPRKVARPFVAGVGHSIGHVDNVDPESLAGVTRTADGVVRAETVEASALHLTASPTFEVSFAVVRESAGPSGAEVDGAFSHSGSAEALAIASPVNEDRSAVASFVNVTRSVAELERGAAIAAFRGSSAALHLTSGVAARSMKGPAGQGPNSSRDAQASPAAAAPSANRSTGAANTFEVGSSADRHASADVARDTERRPSSAALSASSAAPGNGTAETRPQAMQALTKALRSAVAPRANSSSTSSSDLGDRNASSSQSFMVSSQNISSGKVTRSLHTSGAPQNKTVWPIENASAAEDDVAIATYQVIEGEVVRVSDDASVSKSAPRGIDTPKHAESRTAADASRTGNQTAALLSARRRAVGNALKNAIIKAGINLTRDSPFQGVANGSS